MKRSRHQEIARRKRRIERRLAPRRWKAHTEPMYRARNIQYEHSDRVRGLATGGIGAMHQLVQDVGLVEAIDQRVEVLKVALPYQESDHVLGIAYNVLCGGTCLQDIELRRQDEVYLDALGAQRIPDPTTAGDFCRRFDEVSIEACVRVWRAQPDAFFAEAFVLPGATPRRYQPIVDISGAPVRGGERRPAVPRRGTRTRSRRAAHDRCGQLAGAAEPLGWPCILQPPQLPRKCPLRPPGSDLDS